MAKGPDFDTYSFSKHLWTNFDVYSFKKPLWTNCSRPDCGFRTRDEVEGVTDMVLVLLDLTVEREGSKDPLKMRNQRTVSIKVVLKNILASGFTNCMGEETERRPFVALSMRRDEAQDGAVVMEDIKAWKLLQRKTIRRRPEWRQRRGKAGRGRCKHEP